MTLAYAPDALSYDAGTDAFALRRDFDPGLHRIDIEGGLAMALGTDDPAAWNDPGDPSIVHVRDMNGVPVHAGHAYVAERFMLTNPDGGTVRIDLLEIDHDPIGYIATETLHAGVHYRLAPEAQPYRTDTTVTEVSGFGPGTIISTAEGDLPVEWLVPGDAVMTLGDGPQPLRWIGRTHIDVRRLCMGPDLLPLRICPDAFERHSPSHPLLIAPGTRVLVNGADVALNFGLDDALARIGALSTPDAETVTPTAGFTYFTLLFDRHEIIRANGLWCESLFLDARCARPPHLQTAGPPSDIRHRQTALPALHDWEARLLRGANVAEVVARRASAA